jgi:hypothetical protein
MTEEQPKDWNDAYRNGFNARDAADSAWSEASRRREAEDARGADTAGARRAITATPYTWRDPALIPPRRWIYGRHYIRKFVSTTVAPGGVGKSSLVLTECIAIATGRNLLGVIPKERTNVWYWNGEDPAEETELRIAAICLHYGVLPAELDGRLFVDSGRDMPICIASMSGSRVATAEGAVDDISAALIEHDIGVLAIDPFVSSHGVPENDNGVIDAVAKTYGRIAGRADADVELVHHVRKPAQNQPELLIDDARGASALVNAARTGRVLNRMSSAEASQAKVEERRSYFRADGGKTNLAPPEEADWFKLVSVAMPNGDSVGVVISWVLPGVMEGVTTAHMHRVRELVRERRYRKDARSPDWIGGAVAEVLGLDVDTDKDKLKAVLKTWFANGVLKSESHRDEKKRKAFEFVVPGDWNDDAQV